MTFDPHRLISNLSDKINLQRSDKYFLLSNLGIYYGWKKTRHIKTINLKYQLLISVINLNYLMDHNFHQILQANDKK